MSEGLERVIWGDPQVDRSFQKYVDLDISHSNDCFEKLYTCISFFLSRIRQLLLSITTPTHSHRFLLPSEAFKVVPISLV